MAGLCVRLLVRSLLLWAAVRGPAWATGLAWSFATIEAAPWAYRDAAGRPSGVFPEIVSELERRSGDRIVVSLYPLVRVDQALESGQQDCAIILWNDYRTRFAVRGEDVHPMPFGVIARKGTRLEHYDDLVPLVISVTRSLAMHPRFDGDMTLHKDVDKDYLIGLRKIAHGRADAIAGALPTIWHIARQAGLDGHLGTVLTLGRVPLALQCSKRSPRLAAMDRIDGALRAMRADGSLARILSGHGYF